MTRHGEVCTEIIQGSIATSQSDGKRWLVWKKIRNPRNAAATATSHQYLVSVGGSQEVKDILAMTFEIPGPIPKIIGDDLACSLQRVVRARCVGEDPLWIPA